MKKIESYQSLKDDSDRYAVTAEYAKQSNQSLTTSIKRTSTLRIYGVKPLT